MKPSKIVTDALGFRLEVEIVISELAEGQRGQHKTYEQDGSVPIDAIHRITISPIIADRIAEVAAHEAFHLFYSIRDWIRADEETQATVFGQLVFAIHKEWSAFRCARKEVDT